MSEPRDAGHDPEPPIGGRGSLSGTIAGVLGAVLVFLLIVLGLLWAGDGGDGDGDEDPPITGSPVASGTGEPGRTDGNGSPAPTTTPTPTGTPTRDGPSDAAAAAFAASYDPPGGRDVQSLTVDATGDGSNEVVVASVAGDVTRVDVAVWSGSEYEVVFSDQGGPAAAIDHFDVRDLDGDGLPDVLTIQTSGQVGESLSLWGWDGTGFERREADGGCWDGSHTYGITGVELRSGEIAATCDDSPLPVEVWSTDVYVWQGGAWTYDRTETP